MLSFLTRSSIEEEIISGLQSGGPQRHKWEKKLYEQFFYLINYGTKKYKIPEDESASVYSDTIISVIDNIVLNRYERKAALKTFTTQIFMNKCVDAIRKKTTQKNTVQNEAVKIDSIALMLPDHTQNIVQELIYKSDLELLKQKLEELGEKCRKILLFFEDGYSDKEIAAEMLYNSPEVVKTTRLRCIEKLREKVMLNRI